jgi:hypothetical protein
LPMLDLLPSGENRKQWKQSGTRTPNCHYEIYTSFLGHMCWGLPLSWADDQFRVELGAAL